VAAYFGLTSRRWQSGTSIGVQGRISKAGDPDVRRALYEAASALMPRFKGRDKVQTWGLALAKRSCHRKATVAVARKSGGDHARDVDGWYVLRRRRGGQRKITCVPSSWSARGRRLAVSSVHARVPVMMLRHSEGNMRRDDSRPATTQSDQPVAECGGLHGAPGLSAVVAWRVPRTEEWRSVAKRRYDDGEEEQNQPID
jgi:hypothetical protein